MTDPITPEKLRELADDLECGEGGIWLRPDVAAEFQVALGAAADEIERLRGGNGPLRDTPMEHVTAEYCPHGVMKPLTCGPCEDALVEIVARALAVANGAENNGEDLETYGMPAHHAQPRWIWHGPDARAAIEAIRKVSEGGQIALSANRAKEG